MVDSRKDQELERVQQPNNAYLANGTLPDEIIVHIGSYLPRIKDLSLFNQTSWLINSIFKKPLNESAYKILAQAVIDDDRAIVKKLLDIKPSLVLFIPSKGIEIESKLTWQRFYLTENILTIAVKRKQIDLLEFLLPYCDCDQIKPADNFDIATARTKALSAWTFYKMQTNEKGKEEIVIPKEYADYAQKFINVFKKETFPGDKLSDDTEVALISLFERLLPEKAARLEDYLDPELLLLAVYRAYKDNFPSFNYNWKQLDAFCIRVIGLIQSVQTPETGEKICEGADDVVSAEEKGIKKEISQRAKEHKLKGGEPFYRSSRDSHDGVGSSYFAGYGSARVFIGWLYILSLSARVDKVCQAKQEVFRTLRKQSASLQSQNSTNHKRSRCGIS